MIRVPRAVTAEDAMVLVREINRWISSVRPLPIPLKRPLTPKQLRVFDYVKNYIDSKRYAPTLNEIARHCDFKSLATVHEYLLILQRRGYIVQDAGKSRGITIVPQ